MPVASWPWITSSIHSCNLSVVLSISVFPFLPPYSTILVMRNRPLLLFHNGLVSNTFFRTLTLVILSFPFHFRWNVSNLPISCSIWNRSLVLTFLSLSLRVFPAILRKNVIYAAVILFLILVVVDQLSAPWVNGK